MHARHDDAIDVRDCLRQFLRQSVEQARPLLCRRRHETFAFEHVAQRLELLSRVTVRGQQLDRRWQILSRRAHLERFTELGLPGIDPVAQEDRQDLVCFALVEVGLERLLATADDCESYQCEQDLPHEPDLI